MTGWSHTPVLGGRHVSLEPLLQAHAAELSEAAADGELWNLGYANVPRPDAMATYIAWALEQQLEGNQRAFAVRDAGGTIVGSTRLYGIDRSVPRVMVGYTWYAARVQRTGLNTEAKLLLLGHAFGVLRCACVGFETSSRNAASRAAITALGARQDGVLRHHRRHADGTLRDTVAFSIIDSEWPAVEHALQARLARAGARHG